MFGALVILLLLMALAVAFTRLRLDQRATASPYGGLAAVASATTPQIIAVPPAAGPGPATVAPPVPMAAPPAASPAPRPAAAAVPPTIAPAAVPPVVAQAASVAQPPLAAPVPAPLVASPAPDANADGRRGSPTRQIAMGKADIGASPQPAPAALVAAAARAASEPPAAPAPVRLAALTPPADDATGSGRVNINTASADQLNEIGAGHVGRTIVRHRPYRSLEDLVERRVLKARDFARIRAAISVN